MLGYSVAIYAILGIAIGLDIATGITQAVYNRTLDSKILRNGMFHKLSYVFAVALALFLEWACRYIELGFDCKVFIPLAIYIVVTEIVSVLENITKLNPDLKESPIFKLLSSAQNRRKDDEKEN